ncbi:MAG: apolipoprotein N-acyltransferase [Bdellovibrionales bacterium]|nr:apolipoprotein N-acyltransferase [Bdellovibrionales bacterium]
MTNGARASRIGLIFRGLFRGIDRRIFFSVALLFLTFEPLHWWWCATFALVPWFDVIAKAPTPREAVRQSFWLCFFFSLVTFAWVAYVIHTFGAIPWPLAAFLLLLFAAIGQPQFYFAAIPLRYALGRLRTDPRPLVVLGFGFLVALFYAGLDWTLPKMFVDTLGHSLIYARTLRQAADIGGPAFLTFLLLLANVAIYVAIDRFRNRGEPAIWPAVKLAVPSVLLAVFVLVGADRYGRYRLAQVAESVAHPKRTLQAAAIQANIGDIEKLASEHGYREAAERVLRAYYDLSDEALKLEPKPDVLLWPETAYPSTFRSPETSDDFARDKEVESFVASRKVPLAFGGYDRDMRGRSYNAVFYLNPDGTDSRYAKTILIPFGEYIPGAELFPFIKRLFPMVGFFGSGPGSVIRTVDGVKTQPVICYEVLFPTFIRDAVKQGAEVIFNFTNDSWFGPIGAPYYHLNLAAFRSIETRVPQLRSTNTGFSVLVEPDGEIVRRTKLFEPEIMNVTIPIIEPIPTLMVKWGDWFGRTALLVAGLILLVLSYQAKHDRNKKR